MKKKYKLALLIGTPIAIIAGLVYWLSWSGSTDHIESVANQFKADSSWKLVDKTSRPPQTLCIGMTCPYYQKVWTTGKPVTQDELLQILRRSGWNNIQIDDYCLTLKAETSQAYLCSAYGYVDKYSVRVSVDGDNPVLRQPVVTISLE